MGAWGDALRKEGGCGIVFLIVGALFFAGGIYVVFFGGNPDAAKFQKACWAREMASMSDVEIEAFRTQIIVKCDRALKIYLNSKR